MAFLKSFAVRLFQACRPCRYRSCALVLEVACLTSGVAPLSSWGRSASAMERASSSSTAKTFSSLRSYVFDHRWYPSAALTSWATMRRSFPSRRTLPSSTVATASSSPIFRTLSFFPLKANAEVRETTRTPSTLASALITSSVMPSEKYSSSFSRLMLTKGSTATEGAAGKREAVAAVLTRARETKCQATAATPINTTPLPSSARTTPARREPPSLPSGSVRSMPPGLTSNTHARTWSTAKLTMAYPSSARNTRLRLSSARSGIATGTSARNLAPGRGRRRIETRVPVGAGCVFGPTRLLSQPPERGSHAVQEALPAAGAGWRDGGDHGRLRGPRPGPGWREEAREPERRRIAGRRDCDGPWLRRWNGGCRRRPGLRLVTDALRRTAGEAWAFRARVEREAAKRFRRLSAAIPAFDPESPVSALLVRAAGDEERHAELCAGLSAWDGRPDGGSAADVPIA